ncbi:nuclear transport factor 2 family protein [Streptomyces sp. NPDC001985]|uniref:nuclear transport factor 2 family protein n=1 Tax=Streptomyces sp. NPDC001985 TaxID=3154406 RepID=UPI00331EA935
MKEAEKRSIDEVIAGELRLLDPAVRADPERLLALLDPGFVEFGVSGRRWDRTNIAEAVASDEGEPAKGTPGAGSPADGGPNGGESTPVMEVGELTGRVLAPGLIQVTYVSEPAGRRALRSSLWRESADGWRMCFHQGTPAAGPPRS